MYSAPYSCRILMKLECSRQIFEEILDIKFYQNPSSGSRVVPCGRTHGRTDRQTDRRTDMTKLIIAFRNFANVLKNVENMGKIKLRKMKLSAVRV